MRQLSAACSCCGKRRGMHLPAGVLICCECDTALSRKPGSTARGCPPNMPGAFLGYVYADQETPDAPEGETP
jgi:hypothetical protein